MSSKKKAPPAEGTTVQVAPKLVELGGRKHRVGSRYYGAMQLAVQTGSGKATEEEFRTAIQGRFNLAASTARNWAPQIFKELGLEFREVTPEPDGQA